MVSQKSLRVNPIIEAGRSAGAKNLKSFEAFIGENTSTGTVFYFGLDLNSSVIVDAKDIVHVTIPTEPTKPATIIVRGDAKAVFRATIDLSILPKAIDGSQASKMSDRNQALREKGGVGGTAKCTSQYCKGYDIFSPQWSACQGLCQCLNETDNSVLTCIRQAIESLAEAQLSRG